MARADFERYGAGFDAASVSTVGVNVQPVARRMMRTNAMLAALVLAAVALSGCGEAENGLGGQGFAGAGGGTVARLDYVEQLVPNPQGSLVGVPSRVTDLLPNRLVPGSDGAGYPYVRTVVIGDVVSVAPERASVWPGTGAEGDDRQNVEFTNPKAESRTWLIRLAVEDVVAESDWRQAVEAAVDGDHVTVRFVTAGGPVDVERFQDQMSSLQGAVWFLKTRRVWDDAFDVAWMGRAVATIDGGGALRFPLLGTWEGARGDVAKTSLDELRALAKEPASIIEELRGPS